MQVNLSVARILSRTCSAVVSINFISIMAWTAWFRPDAKVLSVTIEIKHMFNTLMSSWFQGFSYQNNWIACGFARV